MLAKCFSYEIFKDPFSKDQLFNGSSSFGRDPHFQMLAVMVLSQHRVSTSKTVSPRIPVGGYVRGMSE